MPILVSADKQEAWLRALARSKRDKVRLWQLKSTGGWRARSAGPNKQIYTLSAIRLNNEPHTRLSCDCKGAGYMGFCKHLIRLAMRLHKRGVTIRL